MATRRNSRTFSFECGDSGIAPPLGILQVPRRRLIDVDEYGATFERCNRMGGWAVKVLRIQKDGHYHQGIKITVIFAIEPGDPALLASSTLDLMFTCRWHHHQHILRLLRLRVHGY
jgi:hypothetical protein